jgi:hypothetical protein
MVFVRKNYTELVKNAIEIVEISASILVFHTFYYNKNSKT